MNAKQRYNAKRAAKHRAERRAEVQLSKSVGAALCGSHRVYKAINFVDARKPEDCGSVCLPDVALYAAGHRKSGDVTAR